MPRSKLHIDNLVKDLQERAKELNCLYKIEELLSDTSRPLDSLLQSVVETMPSGWQYADLCQVRITYKDRIYQTPGFKESSLTQSVDLLVQDKCVGDITVVYTQDVPQTDGEFFLKEEKRLLRTVSERIGHTILHHELKKVFDKWQGIKEELSTAPAAKWRIILDTLRRSDKKLFLYISNKMLRNLCLNGIEEANALLKQLDSTNKLSSGSMRGEINRPSRKETMTSIMSMSDNIFEIASENMTESQILKYIEKWIREDKTKFMVRAIDDPNSSLPDIIDAITRYRYISSEGIRLSPSVEKGLRVSLIRRFFYEQLEFINVAKKYINVSDYHDIVNRMIYSSDSHGTLGGKSAGLFLANQILKRSEEYKDMFAEIRVPKTWYITTDSLTHFLFYNDLDDIIEQKYRDIDEIRLEYPNIIQIFKNALFPPSLIDGLSKAIDEFGENPIVVRSSSLLEDRLGAAFSGKYKSLFLANQGSKKKRLEALMDAIAEVYASTVGPDPIEYRNERGLLDFFEEMGIMIQEVVGTRIGPYFFPSFAGVAFSNNEFRWSSRIQREDGLIRLVPGLGTRVVDRVADDYPMLIAPGNPSLRVNITPEDIVRYSTKKIDVINLETNTFETIDLTEVLKKYGGEIPGIHYIVSKDGDGIIQHPTSPYNLDFEKDNLFVSFEGLFKRTNFIKKVDAILKVLKEKIGTPIDIEFAHDGMDFYLLQCRPQSYLEDTNPSEIPTNIDNNQIIFSANRHVSNGQVPEITHIVYVDPDAYNSLSTHSDLTNIGKAVERLNKLLPKRQFILMGPGRWGSRGDIKLGVSVTYAAINNTAMLIEIARKKGNFTPELSFGTHFFQDLVESAIAYLPLYPDEDDVIFNSDFLTKSYNIFPKLVPELSKYAKTVFVIDVPKATDGKILRVLMNADIVKALAFIDEPDSEHKF